MRLCLGWVTIRRTQELCDVQRRAIDIVDTTAENVIGQDTSRLGSALHLLDEEHFSLDFFVLYIEPKQQLIKTISTHSYISTIFV